MTTPKMNSLAGLRICLAGSFRMPTISMNKELRQLGVVQIDRVTTAVEDRTTTPPPAKESTNLFVVGDNPPEDCLRRYELNCHDGYCAVRISEDDLYSMMRGEQVVDVPQEVVKKVSIDYSYYEWQTPIANINRASSPVKYDLQSILSPVARLEIYVPELPGINRAALCQLIGNFGGYASSHYYGDTDIVMLADSTVDSLKSGNKDNVILQIEKDYNKSNSKTFNIRFSRVSDFVMWAKFRLEKCPDPLSIDLLNSLYQ